jgi:hypothetical protein
MPKPKPFSRPSLTLITTPREWRENVKMSDIHPDDTIAEVGLVVELHIDFVRSTVTIINGIGEPHVFRTSDTVRAFVRTDT